jgi:hypothetical protein
MFKQLKLVASLAITATLAACGGGGGEDSDNSSVSVNNPLKKYEGTWYVCHRQTKEIATYSSTGDDKLSVSFSSEFYSGEECSGELRASYDWGAVALMTYRDTISETLPAVTIFPVSATVDRVSIVSIPFTATLTGSSVLDYCRHFHWIKQYIPMLLKECSGIVRQQDPGYASLYLTADNQYFVQTLYLNSGAGYPIFSRDSTFSLGSLVKRDM